MGSGARKAVFSIFNPEKTEVTKHASQSVDVIQFAAKWLVVSRFFSAFISASLMPTCRQANTHTHTHRTMGERGGGSGRTSG